jgi:hypothetical protein
MRGTCGRARRRSRAVGVVAVGVVALVLGLLAAGCADDAPGTADDAVGNTTTAADETTTTAAAEAEGEADVRARELTVTGPITGGRGMMATATPIDLDAAGYLEEEYFISGEATAYGPVGELGLDGRWEAQPVATAPFTTRFVVRRPADPAAFNGVVVVEWFNASSDVDIDIDFVFAGEELLRGGYAWVGVTAQAIGIEGDGTTSPFGPGALGLQAWDGERYAELAHPGDEFSYDIFTAVGESLRSPGDVDPLDGLDVEHLLATGESQSAFRLLTYANAVAPLAGVYDGILIHSRGGSGAPLGPSDTMLGGDVPLAAQVRTDLDVPVLQVQTETDLIALVPTSPFTAARQPDSGTVRTWEVAGTAHADSYYLARLSEQGLRQFDGFLDLSGVLGTMNSGPQNFVMNAAVRWLWQWAAEGTEPPSAPPIEVAGGAIVRDGDGNAIGGLRTPQVDVPLATLTGEGMSMVGRTVPFDDATLAARYGDEAGYLAAFTRALDATIEAGFLLEDDRAAILADAAERYPG